MATRACVAIKKGRSWKGVYNHWDGYPSGLGKDVWDYLHPLKIFSISELYLEKFAEELLKYDDWRNFLNGGRCPYCGRVGLSQPHSINGKIIIEPKKDIEIAENIKKTGYPDPECKYHKHDNLEEIEPMTPKNSDPLFIEWVYVINVKKVEMEILKSVRTEGYHYGTAYDGSKFRIPNYTWKKVAEIDLNGLEPDWNEIEEKGYELSEKMYEKFERCG